MEMFDNYCDHPITLQCTLGSVVRQDGGECMIVNRHDLGWFELSGTSLRGLISIPIEGPIWDA